MNSPAFWAQAFGADDLFKPMNNPIGFGAVDFIVLFIALFLAVLAFFWRSHVARAASRLARRPGWCMLVLALLPVLLRLALLAHHPVPTADIYDEFGHLLVADTLRHFRLANPPHPLHRFFETFFVLQQPTYSCATGCCAAGPPRAGRCSAACWRRWNLAR
jgi:hypothetical protein